MSVWHVYIIECADGSLYTGITNNLEQRLVEHNNGSGAKYTRGRGPHILAFSEPHPDRSAASKREMQIKALSKTQKRNLIAS